MSSASGYHRAAGARGHYRSQGSVLFERTYGLAFQGHHRQAWPAFAINADGTRRLFTPEEQEALAEGFDSGVWDYQREMERALRPRRARKS